MSTAISPPEESEVLCSNCGGPNTHHFNVEIFEREKEDSEKGLHLAMYCGTAFISKDLDGCPSPRRDGVIIHLECEHCNAVTEIAIYQHKGSTYIKQVLVPGYE